MFVKVFAFRLKKGRIKKGRTKGYYTRGGVPLRATFTRRSVCTLKRKVAGFSKKSTRRPGVRRGRSQRLTRRRTGLAKTFCQASSVIFYGGARRRRYAEGCHGANRTWQKARQQMRGSCAPSAMASRRRPPMAVCSTTWPGLKGASGACTVPMRAASAP